MTITGARRPTSATTNDVCFFGECHGSDTCVGINACIVATCGPSGCTALDKCPPMAGPCGHSDCVTATGECIVVAMNEGVSCDDGNECTASDRCVAGSCEGVGITTVLSAAPAMAPGWLAGAGLALGAFAVWHLVRRRPQV